MTSHLTVPDLKERLVTLGLPIDGKRAELQRRLRKALSKIKADRDARAKQDAANAPPVDSRQWRPKLRNFLVTDVEATCEADERGGGFAYPNEIIEWPIVLVRVVEPDNLKSIARMEVVDEFHTYINPKHIPTLTDFCKTLTGITQEQVDASPRFQEVVWDLYEWLSSHDLIDTPDGVEPLSNYPATCKGQWGENAWHPVMQSSLKKDTAWLTHGPHDLLSFVPKAAWINGLLFGPPRFLRGPIVDVRKCVHGYLGKYIPKPRPPREDSNGRTFHWSKREPKPRDQAQNGAGAMKTDPTARDQTAVVSANKPLERLPERGDGSIPGLLQSLGMDEFQGKLHCGLDDTRNIARILVEIGRIVFEGLATDEDNEEVEQPATEQDADPTKPLPASSTSDTTSREPSRSATPTPGSRPRSPPPSKVQLLQSLLQANLEPYEYPPFPPLLSEEDRRVMNDPLKSTLSDSDRRLLRGGGRFYPRRYDWMGKKVGTVKWE